MNRLFKHLAYFRELYIWPWLSVLSVLGVINLAVWLSGRSVVDDPGALVGMTYQFFGLVVAAAFTAIIDGHLFHDLSSEEWDKATLGEKILDVSKTLAVLFVALYFIKH